MEFSSFDLPGNQSGLEDNTSSTSIKEDAVEDDGTPVLDEADLEENELTIEEAERIEWDEPKGKKGSSGSEEKDITD
jgi:hypothetical protein